MAQMCDFSVAWNSLRTFGGWVCFPPRQTLRTSLPLLALGQALGCRKQERAGSGEEDLRDATPLP